MLLILMSTNKRIIPIANFLASGLYTDIMHNKVSSCLPTDIKKFMYFNDMCDDLSLCVNEYNERKLTNNNVNNSHMSVIMKESSIISYIYDGDSLNKLFESKKKYVYKPIYCNIDSQLHLLMMIINIKKRSIYIFDSNNNLFIRGRLKNMILKPNGINIYPEDIEKILDKHDNIKESCVLGVPHGHDIITTAVILPNKNINDKELKNVINKINQKLEFHQKIQNQTNEYSTNYK